MKYTGERVIPKVMNPKNGLLLEHIERYEFAKSYSKGRVLDIACGVGYGSGILLEDNTEIVSYVGIDCCKDTIEYAKEHYSFLNTNYYLENALSSNLHQIYGSFNTIISFETIEHFREDKVFVGN